MKIRSALRSRSPSGRPHFVRHEFGARVTSLNKKYKLNESFIKKIAADILKCLKKTRKTELEFVFLDDKAMRNFNKKFKNRDFSTDVLSFRIDRAEFGLKNFIGEIFISTDRACENARRFGTNFEKEITLYIIHGILHLFGYDDEDVSDKTRMSKKERAILDYLCKKEDLSKILMQR